VMNVATTLMNRVFNSDIVTMIVSYCWPGLVVVFHEHFFVTLPNANDITRNIAMSIEESCTKKSHCLPQSKNGFVRHIVFHCLMIIYFVVMIIIMALV